MQWDNELKHIMYHPRHKSAVGRNESITLVGIAVLR